MNKSEQINELALALSKVQGAIRPAQMNAVNPFLKNRYADLGSIIETARALLASNGLSVSQMVGGDDNAVNITSILMHSSGQWMESTVSMSIGEERGKSAAQVAGSIITYLRRYSLASMLGIYADEDTDGHTVVKPPANGAKPTDIQTAFNMKTKNGETYGNLPTDKLSFMANEIVKLGNNATAEHGIKLQAIRQILQARKDGTLTENLLEAAVELGGQPSVSNQEEDK